jgi:hypothetical protein
MEKKDIYEHLAKIYLDAPLKRQQRIKEEAKTPKKVFFIAISTVLLALIFLLSVLFTRNRPLHPSIARVLQSEVVKLVYSFEPAKKEIYTVDLNKQNLVGFNYRDAVSIRIEFHNAFREHSEIYLSDIPHKWQHHSFKLTDFKSIGDWSEMISLSFIIEEWNAIDKKGAVYLDNIRLSR